MDFFQTTNDFYSHQKAHSAYFIEKMRDQTKKDGPSQLSNRGGSQLRKIEPAIEINDSFNQYL